VEVSPGPGHGLDNDFGDFGEVAIADVYVQLARGPQELVEAKLMILFKIHPDFYCTFTELNCYFSHLCPEMNDFSLEKIRSDRNRWLKALRNKGLTGFGFQSFPHRRELFTDRISLISLS
jgi:hypothetical protein